MDAVSYPVTVGIGQGATGHKDIIQTSVRGNIKVTHTTPYAFK